MALADLLTRGVEALRRGDAQTAAKHFQAVLAIRPGHPVAVRNLGVIFMEAGLHDAALKLAEIVLSAQPDHGEALLMRGEALAAKGRFTEALDAYQRAIAAPAGPAYEATMQLGLARAALRDHAGALLDLNRALALKPGAPATLYRRGIVRMQLRDFGGWVDYEARFDFKRFLSRSGGVITADMAPRIARHPTPASLAGQRVLVLGEQGIGDQVMFASMLPDLAKVAASITLVCEARLAAIFAASFPGLTVSGPKDARVSPSEIDQIVAMGSLGVMFRPNEAAFPGTPYLAPRPAVREAWAARLGPRTGKLRVGLSWRGGLARTRLSERSLTLEQLAPILSLPGCEFVSLQYGDVAEETAGHPLRVFPASEIEDFEQLAGLAANLDLVVSVQTALVHLAGAVGLPCLTLVPHNAEWRYAADGPSMPW